MSASKKGRQQTANIPLIVIILLIVFGLGFFLSSSMREGKRAGNSIPPPAVKPIPNIDKKTEAQSADAVIDTASSPAKAVSSVSKTTRKSVQKKQKDEKLTKQTKEDIISLINKLDREANEKSASNAAASKTEDTGSLKTSTQAPADSME